MRGFGRQKEKLHTSTQMHMHPLTCENMHLHTHACMYAHKVAKGEYFLSENKSKVGHPHVQCHQAQHGLWTQDLETVGILPFGTLYRAMLTTSRPQSLTTTPLGQMKERSQKGRGLSPSIRAAVGPILEPTSRTITLNTASPGVDVSSLCPKSYGFLLAHLSNSTRLEEAADSFLLGRGQRKSEAGDESREFFLIFVRYY